MPTYHARGVSVRLGVRPLADTVTPNIVLRKGDVVRKQCEEAEQHLLNSRFLSEKRVTFPGDDHSYELNWLGGAPFMQSEAGRDLFSRDGGEHSEQSSSTKEPRPRPSRAKAAYASGSDPLALSLHVITSHRTFVSGLNNSNKLHIKIEVFLNGTLSNCLFFPPYEYRSGAKALHQVFGGHRVDFLAERPWVILPPNTAADGTQRMATGSSTVEQRWQEIAKALSFEANERGSNEQSMIPPTAEFLKALAAMNMPAQVRDMQSPGSKTLAIVDVVITAGNGRKVTSGTAYLKAPQRFHDDNFPLRNAAEASKRDDTTPHLTRNQMEARDTSVFEMENESSVAAEEIATSLERHVKRRAIDIDGLPSSFNRPDQQPSEPQNTSRKPRALSICPPTEEIPGAAQDSMMLNLPSSLFSLGPFQACKDHLGSPERGRTKQAAIFDQDTGSLYGGSLHGTPQSFLSVPGSGISHAHSPRTQLSPYSVQFAGSASSQQSPGAFLPSNASQCPDLALNPYHHMQSVESSPLSQIFPHSYSLDSDRFSEHGLPGPAFPPPASKQKLRRSSMGSSSIALSSPTTPQAWPGDELYSQLSAPDQPADFVPNMLPFTAFQRHVLSPRSNGLPVTSPFDRRFSMPLPPTGFFSVPTKPKRSMSPRKQALSVKGGLSPQRFPIRRLVITGKKGFKIVDHTWPAAQYIPTNGQVRSCTASSPSIGSIGSTPAPDAAEIGKANEMKPGQPIRCVKDVPQDRQSTGQLPATAIKGDDTEDTYRVLKLAPNGPHQHEGTVPDEEQTVRPAQRNFAPPKTNLEKPRVCRAPQQRRTASSQGILGIQGPKATAFIFEDPEQLLREAAKEKRIKAPRKPLNRTAAGSDAAIEPRAAITVAITASPPALLSSPLSSVHTTPGIDEATESHTVQATPHTPTATAEPWVSQLDGPSDRPNPISSFTTSTIFSPPSKADPHRITPARRKRSSISTPSLTRYLEKQPRSPDRLKTISNPPLNHDCVVALAESEDKKAKRGILRQVRGERQGVFVEEYVVCATRFYVPGN